MNLYEQLKRDGNLLTRPAKSGPKPRKFLKRTGRPRQVSKRRSKENRTYTVKRKAFLEAKRICYAGPLIDSFALPNDCTIGAQDVHHRAGRYGGNFLNEATWLPVCRNCHNWIHANPKTATAIGMLLPR